MVEKSHTTGLWPSLYQPFQNMGTRLSEWLAPAAEASKSEDAYTIALELPGVDEKDIDLSVDNGVVTVKGEKKMSREEKSDSWYFSERQYGSFSRSFRMPPDADESGVDADLKDGVLTITVPKAAPESETSKKVEIKRG
ncbi:Hsp20/alpha crystallin family protein [Pseudohalocynthiibacter aestuariivivens]|jgi:HSP20 family protein|uniref:Hsp20/alpha crystallin family protein n=1 Tax=Pseudohalocynthiibacter aestuariivivens TaxID=1591409 RepID=A0ABV5JGI9_9RHOB|nr:MULTISPECIES: Hsp20/alpha crystallin family protein [Pseudohalocynthiibacter]MBS9716091.1 Hsp20/alpha crystallin family protein [Pseudohalocynthiibacter aestuariivivens]MCK0101102.1 Hsp20/alpha crystallin family protein [Pseudohalocynthiibacter sp. F2068]